jgi:uncharacterized protein
MSSLTLSPSARGLPEPAEPRPLAADALRDRLARLRRQAGAAAPAAGPAAPARCELQPGIAALAADVERLRRLLAQRPSSPRPAPIGCDDPNDRALPGVRIAPGLRYVEHWLPCPLPTPVDTGDAAADDLVAPGRLLCFDTETTGLAGGSGTRAFMIGAADWHTGGLRLRQLFLETLAAEAAMLAEFARWLDDDRVLVSYNGRCYDAPLLATRYRMACIANPLAGLRHLDLLTPVRRRYRGCWSDCRLATVERELLGIRRCDDLPGAQAPAAWLGFLRGGSAVPLRRVAAHNAQDIDSLARLLLALQARPAG